MKYEIDSAPDPATPVTIYAHYKRQGNGRREYIYVGASTNIRNRWGMRQPFSSVWIARLEETTLARQVERESFWIDHLWSKGHRLLNKRKPEKIRLGKRKAAR